jgi:prolyl oligopeptidase
MKTGSDQEKGLLGWWRRWRRKFAARLGEVGAPYLYFENTDGGHANAADPTANARRWAMHYTYLSRQLMD